MDTSSNRTVALLSIHPVYCDRLLDGTKCVELRRTRLSQNIEYVVIYATAPVQRIVGYFSVEKIAVDSPAAIWSEYEKVSGIESSQFCDYYHGATQAVAIEVATMFVLPSPLPLSILGEDVRPPQSFQYFDHAAVDLLSSYVREDCPAA